MSQVLIDSSFNFRNQISKYVGKVRDVYELKNNILVMIVSDRISAFDVVMPKGITYKGQVLNQIALEMLNMTNDIIENWLIDSPDPNVSIGKKCKPIKVDNPKKMKLFKRGYKNLLKDPSIIYDKKKQNIKLHFDMHHGYGILDRAIKYLDKKDRKDFQKFVSENYSFNPSVQWLEISF